MCVFLLSSTARIPPDPAMLSDLCVCCSAACSDWTEPEIPYESSDGEIFIAKVTETQVEYFHQIFLGVSLLLNICIFM